MPIALPLFSFSLSCNLLQSSATLSDLKNDEDQQVDECADEAVAKQMSSPALPTHTEERAHVKVKHECTLISFHDTITANVCTIYTFLISIPYQLSFSLFMCLLYLWESILISDLTFGDLIARGGQAVVWKGLWEGKDVAITKYTNQTRGISEFSRSSLLMWILSQCTELWERSSRPALLWSWWVADHCMTTSTRRRTNHLLSSVSQAWMKDIATGMGFLHSQGIAHRRLKDPNSQSRRHLSG